MIEKYYASHNSTSIRASAVNVKRKAKSKKAIIEHEKRNAPPRSLTPRRTKLLPGEGPHSAPHEL